MARRGFISSAVAIAVAGCAELPPVDGFGLETVELHVEPSDVARLRAGTFTGTAVPALVDIGGASLVADVSVAGRSSVDDFKKSFNIELGSGERLRLDAMSRDPSAVRGYMTWQIFAAERFPSVKPRHVSVFMNGDYLGLYLLHEIIDAGFFSRRGLEAIAIYAARDNLATMERGSDLESAFSSRLEREHHGDLERLVALIAEGAALDDLLDSDSVIRYMAASHYSDNRDGIVNNYVLYRTRQDRRFAVLPWDLDYSLHYVNHPDDGTLFERNALMRSLWSDPRYLCALAELAAAAPASALDQRLDEIAAHIAEAWRHDRLLGAGEPLEEHIAEIQQRNVEQQEALAALEPCLTTDR